MTLLLNNWLCLKTDANLNTYCNVGNLPRTTLIMIFWFRIHNSSQIRNTHFMSTFLGGLMEEGAGWKRTRQYADRAWQTPRTAFSGVLINLVIIWEYGNLGSVFMMWIPWFKIQIQHFWLNTDPHPDLDTMQMKGFDDQKWKNLQLKISQLWIWIRIRIWIGSGFSGVPGSASWSSRVKITQLIRKQLIKVLYVFQIKHLKPWNVRLFYIFLCVFFPPVYRSGFRIWIVWPDRIRIWFRNTALVLLFLIWYKGAFILCNVLHKVFLLEGGKTCHCSWAEEPLETNSVGSQVVLDS